MKVTFAKSTIMKKDDPESFSFETLWYVTGFSSFAFLVILKFLDEGYHQVFIWTGMAGVSLGLITRLIKILDRKPEKKGKLDVSHK
jgi:hypothetical protein